MAALCVFDTFGPGCEGLLKIFEYLYAAVNENWKDMRPDWKTYYQLLLAGAVLVSLLSCGTEPECATSGSSALKIKFSRIILEPDTALVADTVDFNRVYALGNEDSLIVAADTLTALSLPLKPDEERITFVLENRRKGEATEYQTDTITFRYEARQRLISPDCGIVINYVNLQVEENHTFDTVLLISNELNRDINVNIEIFR